jgi:hypothetical protein
MGGMFLKMILAGCKLFYYIKGFAAVIYIGAIVLQA